MKIVAHQFAPKDLVAGHPALDFVNTVTARDVADSLDWLDGYPRLLDWAELAGLADAPTLKSLRAWAAASPDEAAAALARAKRFREGVHQLASALIDDAPMPAEALAAVEQAWKSAVVRAGLIPTEAGLSPAADLAHSGLDLILDRLAPAAVELLRDLPKPRTRTCRGHRCGWQFIDVSKAGRRVWCDMGTCGNSAKSRRHYERIQSAVSGRKKVRS